MRMEAPRSQKKVQRLTECMAALSRFISRLGEKGLPFYKLLKKVDKFQWTSEAQEALDALKKFLTTPPVLKPPRRATPTQPAEDLLLYISCTTHVVSTALVVERAEEGHAYPVQHPIYFISEVLGPSKKKYPQGEKGLPFYKLLKKVDKFQWTSEAQEALDALKKFLTTPPVLKPPRRATPTQPAEDLLLYISCTTHVVSTALVVERAEEGHAYPVQHPIYFISEVLGPSKKKYPQVQKLLYAVLLTARKLRHYFDDHKDIIVTGCPIGDILHNKEAIG